MMQVRQIIAPIIKTMICRAALTGFIQFGTADRIIRKWGLFNA